MSRDSKPYSDLRSVSQHDCFLAFRSRICMANLTSWARWRDRASVEMRFAVWLGMNILGRIQSGSWAVMEMALQQAIDRWRI